MKTTESFRRMTVDVLHRWHDCTYTVERSAIVSRPTCRRLLCLHMQIRECTQNSNRIRIATNHSTLLVRISRDSAAPDRQFLPFCINCQPANPTNRRWLGLILETSIRFDPSAAGYFVEFKTIHLRSGQSFFARRKRIINTLGSRLRVFLYSCQKIQQRVYKAAVLWREAAGVSTTTGGNSGRNGNKEEGTFVHGIRVLRCYAVSSGSTC